MLRGLRWQLLTATVISDVVSMAATPLREDKNASECLPVSVLRSDGSSARHSGRP